jgi:hypothetical protein
MLLRWWVRITVCDLQLFQVVTVTLDDSYINTKAAYERGWKTAHLLDPSDPDPSQPASKHQIRSLQELRSIFPEVFKSTTAS